MKPLRLAAFDGTVVMIWPWDNWEQTTVEVHLPGSTQHFTNRFIGETDLKALRGLLRDAVLTDVLPEPLHLDDSVMSWYLNETASARVDMALSIMPDHGDGSYDYEFITSRLAVWNLAMSVGEALGPKAV